jgi:hypothetical protein
MTVFADLLANAVSFDKDAPIHSLDRAIVNDINEEIARGDVALPAAGFDAVNEVQTLAASGASAGTFTITVEINDTNVTTAAIAFNANPAAIETAIDTAAAGVPGFTAGDISASGAGTAQLNDTVLTYDGASVAGKIQRLSSVDGTGLTGGGSEAFAETTPGHGQRNVWAIFEALSLVDFGGTVPAQGSLPTLTKTLNKSTTRLGERTLRALALEADMQHEAAGLEALLLDAFDIKTLPPASSQG